MQNENLSLYLSSKNPYNLTNKSNNNTSNNNNSLSINIPLPNITVNNNNKNRSYNINNSNIPYDFDISDATVDKETLEFEGEEKEKIKYAIEKLNEELEYQRKKNEKKKVVTNIKDLDWFSSVFGDKDLKSLFIQNSHIKEILVDQSIYYFIVFSKIFYLWKREIERQRLIMEEEIEREKKRQKYHIQLPPINMLKIEKKIVIPKMKIGVVGCGNIGKKLVEFLVHLKDHYSPQSISNNSDTIYDNIYMNFTIYISSRRPSILINELSDILDNEVHIISDIQKLAKECDLIFICVPPFALDAVSKDIKIGINEKLNHYSNNFNNKSIRNVDINFLNPFIISFLSATPVERIKNMIGGNQVLRTRLIPAFVRNKKKPIFGDDISEKCQYIEESCDHLLYIDKDIKIIESFIDGFYMQFYGNNNLISKDKGYLNIFESIFCKEKAEYYYNIYDIKKGEFDFWKCEELKEFEEFKKIKEESKREENNIIKKEDNRDSVLSSASENINDENVIKINKIKKEIISKICGDFKVVYTKVLDHFLKSNKK